MRATRILHGVLKKSRIPVHKSRLKSVLFGVDALLTGGHLSQGKRSRWFPDGCYGSESTWHVKDGMNEQLERACRSIGASRITS